MSGHLRRHGGRSTPQLVQEAADLHRRIGEAFVRACVTATNRAYRKRLVVLHMRAYRRFLRREVRLEIQQEQEGCR